jgi:acyl-CoA thioester hydrolase
MPAIFHYPYCVCPEDIDELGHASNLAYLKWMQAAAVAHSAEQGWPAQAYQKLGAGWVVRMHQIEYRQSAYAGDQLVIRTWVAGMHKVTSLRRYEIIRPRDDSLLVVAATDWAFIHYATGVPKRIPPEVSQSFEIVGDGTDPQA